jgi:septal ring factor EnvC (AmiA/AmiB activator)
MIRDAILKYKWHLITFALFAAIATVLIYKVVSGSDTDAERKVAEWAMEKRLDMAKEAIARNKTKKASKQRELEGVEKKIQTIEEKKAAVDKSVDNGSLKELDDAWEALGF